VRSQYAKAPIGSPEMTISTRRFCSRPVEVELDTSGRELPKPRTVERPAGNPCPSSIWRTLSARFPACDSVVALSEYPSTTTRSSGYCWRIAATRPIPLETGSFSSVPLKLESKTVATNPRGVSRVDNTPFNCSSSRMRSSFCASPCGCAVAAGAGGVTITLGTATVATAACWRALAASAFAPSPPPPRPAPPIAVRPSRIHFGPQPVSLAFSLCPSKLRLGGLGLQRGNLFFLPPFFRDRAGVLRGLRRLPRQLHQRAAGRLAALQPLRVRQQFLGLRKCLWRVLFGAGRARDGGRVLRFVQ